MNRTGFVRALAMGLLLALPLPPPGAVAAGPSTAVMPGAESRDPVSHLSLSVGRSRQPDRASLLVEGPSRPSSRKASASAVPSSSGSPSAAAASYAVSGRVIDASGAPLSAHLTMLADGGASFGGVDTAADGTFVIYVAAGFYRIAVDNLLLHVSGYWGASGWGYVSGAVDGIDVTAGSVSLTIVVPPQATLEGRVSAGGGLQVVVDLFLGNLLYAWSAPDSDGTWSAPVMPGSYTIGYRYTGGTAYASGWLGSSGFTADSAAAKTISVAAGTVSVGTITLPATKRVSGVVYGPGGTPKAGVVVEGFVNGTYYAQTTTGTTGAYSLKLPSGPVTLWEFDPTGAIAPGWRTSTGVTANPSVAAVTSVTSDVAGISLRAPAASHISGHVFWSSAPGSQATQVDLWVEADAYGQASSGAVTDGYGAFTIPVLPGTYGVWADGSLTSDNIAGGYYRAGTTATADYAQLTAVPVASGGEATITMQVRLPVSAGGVVMDSHGSLVDGVEAALFVNGHFYRDAVSAAGGWRIPGVAPGTYRVAFTDLAGHYRAGWLGSGGWVADYTGAADIDPAATALNIQLPIDAPPAPPTSVTATPYHQSATVSWQAPSTTPDRPIFAYTVTATPGGSQCRAYGAVSCTVSGLADATAYSFTVTAASPVGTSAPSVASAAVQPLAVPGAATAVSAAADGTQADVTWAPAADNGNQVTGYVVTSTPGGFRCATDGATSCQVSNLPDGTYTFSVTAANILGSGPPSAASNAVSIARVARYAGADRFATAAAISENTFSPFASGTGIAYVAYAFNFPDALAAAAAAGTKPGPVLLAATTGTLNTATRNELTRLHPAKIVVLGSTGVIAADVYSQLAALPFAHSIERYAGADRLATAAVVSQNTFTPFDAGTGVAYVAYAYNFPDALAGAAAAGTVRGPVLLAATTGTLNAATRNELVRLHPSKVIVLGSPGVIADDVYAQLAALPFTHDMARYAGSNRFSTAAAVSRATFAPNVGRVFLAYAYNFPDALAGAAAAGTTAGPVLLVGTNAPIDAATADELARLTPKKIVVLGSSGVVSDAVMQAAAAYVP